MNMFSRLTLAGLALLCGVVCTSCTNDNNQRSLKPTDDSISSHQPNVIIIVADQMRRESMQFWQDPKFKNALNGVSDPVVTPNIDQLAHEGVVFNNAIANFPLCSPYRAMLLSGMYPNNNGVDNNTRQDRPSVGLRTDITSLPQALLNEGYNTALIGKGHWHNNLPGYDQQNRYLGVDHPDAGHFFTGTAYDTFIPPGSARQGLEYWYQALGHNHASPVVYTNDEQLSGVPEGHPFYPKVYSAVDQANVIIDYINNTRQQRASDKPFALLWAMDPPHSPYDKLEDTDADIYQQHYADLDVKTLLNRPNVDVVKAKEAARYHFSMVTLIDREIGRVREALKQAGLDANTLIIFTADHGEMMGSHGLMTKNFYYEESLGIPLIFHYPKALKPHVNTTLISVPDVLPTVLGLVNFTDKIPSDIDGTNFSKALLDQRDGERNSSLYYGKDSELGVRTKQYTFVLNKNGQLAALFDNREDPYQQTSLSLTQIPLADANALKAELGFWLTKIKHPWAQARLHPAMVTYPNQ